MKLSPAVWIATLVLSGVITAIALFGVTGWTPTYGYLGPLCQTRTVIQPGFDAWTGEPHGRTFECADILNGGAITLVEDEPPDDLIDRRAVPLPVGFALGVTVAGSWLTVALILDRRRREIPRSQSG